jgi:Tol biopolymer transport system component
MSLRSASRASSWSSAYLKAATRPMQEHAEACRERAGRRIAYAGFLRIYVVDRNGHHRRLVVKGDDGGPRWSPNGRQLAYAGAGALKTLEIVDVATHHIRTLGTDPVYPGGPDWSRNGRLVFSGTETEDIGDNSEIYVIGSNGKGLRKLIAAPSGVDLAAPSWSPDGKRLLYTWHRDSTTYFFLARADGSHRRRLIRTNADAVGSWSWDGTRIAFGVTDIRILNLRTGALRKDRPTGLPPPKLSGSRLGAEPLTRARTPSRTANKARWGMF